MKVMILEDENRAVNHLKRLIHEVAPEMEVISSFDTVRDAVQALEKGPMPGLVFSDVQLADGLSFEIFRQVEVTCPIIFTTAYDSYAIEAFSTNGIDYLLKPIEEERLRQAIHKVRQFSPSGSQAELAFLKNLAALSDHGARKASKSRFMIRVGEKIRSIGVEEVLVFYSLERSSFLRTREHRNYPVDYTMDELEGMLDPARFFRVNRKFIVAIEACSQIIAYTNSRLKIELQGVDEEIIVARERVRDFKAWLDQ